MKQLEYVFYSNIDKGYKKTIINKAYSLYDNESKKQRILHCHTVFPSYIYELTSVYTCIFSMLYI